jgi:hypothetical protein
MMPKRKSNKILAWVVLSLFLIMGCHFRKEGVPEGKPFLPKIKRLVVIGFLPVVPPGDEPGMVQSPLSGAVFMAEPVPRFVADKMTANLFNRIVKDRRYELISPAQAKGVFSSLISTDLASDDIEIFRKIGQAFSADAVLMGYIYRWREREGTDYAVRRPASVAFELYLIRPDDGAILRKGRFDKSQRSLSENIFDLETFLKGGGKWMTVENLADFGLTNLLGKLPSDEAEESE